MFLYDQNIIGSSSENFGYLQKCSEYVRKPLSGLRTTFEESSEIFGKCWETFAKSSKNSSLVCLSNKQNNTWVHVDMEFLFLCSTWYLSSERSERLRSSWTREQKFHIYVQLCVILCLSFYLLSRLQIFCLFPMLFFFLFFHSKNAPLVKTLTRQRVARYFQVTLATFKIKTNKFI